MIMVNAEPIHFIGAAISIALFYQSYRLVKKRKESVFEFLLWATFGTILLVLSISSAVTVLGVLEGVRNLLYLLGFESGRDGIFVLAILGLLLMLFYTYVNVKTNRKDLYDMNQEVALLKYELQKRESTDVAENDDD